MEKITVLLVEDHEVIPEGLRALLDTQQDIEVVGEASNGRDGVNLTRRMSPDVAVMDISMPELNGLEATREINRAMPGTKVLVLSSYDDLDCVQAMSDAGATGFLSKRSASNQLPEAIRAICSGKTFYSPEIVKLLQDRKNAALKLGKPACDPFTLTHREAEVLQLIAEGFPNKGIGAKLGISTKTVEKHRQSAMNKLNIHDIAGLTRYALKKGMVSEKVPDKRMVGSSENGNVTELYGES